MTPHNLVPMSEPTMKATVAHEIKNPLEAIINLLHLVKTENDAGTRNHFVDLIEREVNRIAKVAREGLDCFRANPHPTHTNVAELAANVLELYAASFAAHGIKIRTRLKESCLPGEADGLHQVISNLLVNALDAMPAGGYLNLRAAPAREWHGKHRHGIRLTVADNGCGIAAENQGRAVNTHFTSKGPKGTGLGLPVVKGIVQLHGGTIRLRSSTRPNRSGTVVQIFLPA
jgi:signal transduction histidine kinase